jgi:hypothetical protein
MSGLVLVGLLALFGAQAADSARPVTLIGCVSGGNLQPVEQPFMLEASEPWVLIDVLTESSTISPINYRVTGINLAPWIGMRVRVQGTVIPVRAGDAKALPEIKATLVHSTWGTCPSPATWRPPAATKEQRK